jgi:hypothetical protein
MLVYVLPPSPAATAAPPPTVGRDVTVGLGPIVLPKYLDRPQIVTRIGEDETFVRAVHRILHRFPPKS